MLNEMEHSLSSDNSKGTPMKFTYFCI